MRIDFLLKGSDHTTDEARINRRAVKWLADAGFGDLDIVRATGLTKPTVDKHLAFAYPPEPPTGKQVAALAKMLTSAKGQAFRSIGLRFDRRDNRELVSEYLSTITYGNPLSFRKAKRIADIARATKGHPSWQVVAQVAMEQRVSSIEIIAWLIAGRD